MSPAVLIHGLRFSWQPWLDIPALSTARQERGPRN